MSERGMGAAVGQVPEYTTLITSWVKEVATIPVIVKLTPNVTDVAHMAWAARQGEPMPFRSSIPSTASLESIWIRSRHGRASVDTAAMVDTVGRR